MIKKCFSIFLIIYLLNIKGVIACEPGQTFVLYIPKSVIPCQSSKVISVEDNSGGSGAAVAVSLGAGLGSVAAGGILFGPKIMAALNNSLIPVEKISDLSLNAGVMPAKINDTKISAGSIHLYPLKLPKVNNKVIKVTFKSGNLKDNDLEFSLLNNYSPSAKVKYQDLYKFRIKPISSVHNNKTGIIEKEFMVNNTKDNYVLLIMNKNNKAPVLDYNILIELMD